MFRENRLIHFSSTASDPSSDPDATPKPKTESLDPKQEKEEAEKQAKIAKTTKVNELKTRVRNANISAPAKNLANTVLARDDDNEIELVEKLLDGQLTQAEFEEKITEYQDKAKGIKSKKLPDITADVAARSAKVSAFKSQTPEELKQNTSFGKHISSLGSLSALESSNQSKVEKLLAPFVKLNKLDAVSQSRIVNLDPNSPDFTFYLKKYLGPLATDNKLIDKIKILKEEQKQIIADFENLAEKLEAAILENQEKYNNEKQRYLRLKRLKRASGITVAEGIKLEYLHLDKNLNQSLMLTQIQKVEYKRVESSYFDENESDLERKKEQEEEQLNMPYELFITITSVKDGKVVQESLSERDFLEWVNQMQVTEVVSTLVDLEKNIDFSDFGQSLKAGMDIEYVSTVNPNGVQVFDSVKIKKIDPDKGLIHLDKAVPVVTNKLTRKDPVLDRNRTKSILTFGEFSKWYNGHHAEQKMSLTEARGLLKKFPGVYKNRYPDLDPNLWQFNNLPIELKPNEELSWGENKTVTITSVDEDNINLSNGKNYTPGQFIRFVKQNEVERESTVPSTEEIQGKLDKVLKESSDTPSTSTPLPGNTPIESDRRGILMGIWKNTNILSINDLIKMFQTLEEFFKRKTERNSKRRAASAGKILPGRLGLEFKNLAQASENEEVDKIQGELKNQGVDDWRSYLLESNGNTDIIKACTNLLCEAGAYDFEDPAMWMAMNSAYKEQVDEETYELNAINMNSRKNPAGKTAIDALKFIMDSMWGKPSGNNWFNQNKSSYNSEMGKFEEEANTNELAEGGYEGVLHDMLVRHANGEYVSAARFESYIRYLIKMGKSTPEDRFYYLLAGYVTRNPVDGTYLLSKNKYGDINNLLNKLPHLDYFTRFPWIMNGTPEESRALMSQIFNELESNLKPGWNVNNRYNATALADFTKQDVMTHKNVIKRISRVLRNARENIDHDDAPIMVPALDSSDILQVIGNLRGSDSFLSSDGYLAGLRGFNDYLKALGNVSMKSDKEKNLRDELGYEKPEKMMQQTLKSFLFYEASLSGRVKFGEYTTLTSEKLNTMVGNTGLTVRQNANQVKEVLRKILKAYGFKDNQIYLFLDYKSGKTNESKNKDHLQEMMKFPNEFDKAIKDQGSAKMVSIVQQAIKSGNLLGDGGAILKVEKPEDDDQADVSPKNDDKEQDELRDPNDVMGNINAKVKKAA